MKTEFMFLIDSRMAAMATKVAVELNYHKMLYKYSKTALAIRRDSQTIRRNALT